MFRVLDMGDVLMKRLVFILLPVGHLTRQELRFIVLQDLVISRYYMGGYLLHKIHILLNALDFLNQ
jgi:hypothetical protein